MSVIEERHRPVESASSADLLPTVNELMTHAGWRLSDLQGVAIASGPGSFSGLRVGATVAKSLNYSNGIPIAAVSTLQAIAWQYRNVRNSSSDTLAVVLDAQRRELFLERFLMKADRPPESLSELEIISIEGALERLKGMEVCGPAAISLSADETCREPSIRIVPAASAESLVIALGQLAFGALSAGISDDWKSLHLNYGRRSAAEEKMGCPFPGTSP